MSKRIVLVMVCIVLVAAMLAGCNESYKTKAVPTDTSDLTVSSNGDLAVKVGKYLYYINGYAGNDIDNTFGKVQKGGIARVELDASGNPIKSTNMLVVAKNVYNTAATSGLYVSDGYIYYSTPSIDKDSKGNPKVGQMWLMRTKLDGTDTKVVKKFEDYTAVYKVVKDYILYVLDGELYAINTTTKKFKEQKIDEKITSYIFTKYEDGQNSFINSIFYLKAAEHETSYHNTLWCYTAGGKAHKVLDADAATFKVTDVHPTGFQLSLTQAVYAGDKVRLVYGKTDQGTNKTSAGTYSYDFGTDLTFDVTKEVRYSKKTTYTNYQFLDDSNAIVNNGNNIDWLYKTAQGEWERMTLIPSASSEAKVFKIDTKDNVVSIYYMLSNIIYAIPVLETTITDGKTTYTAEIKSSSVVFDASVSTAWLQPDLVGNTVYYFNANVLDNTYYLNLTDVKERDTDSRIGKLLGIITAEEELQMLASA